MLKRVNGHDDMSGAQVRIADAGYPSPFAGGLEFAAPARGTWNIVHTGFLIPEAHEIFVCAAGCLRGVVLTAAEMGAASRFSTIEVKEHNLIDGDMEELIVEGVSDILNKLPKFPPAVLVYTSCVHHFIGCDLDMVYRELRSRFPQVDFTDCYMTPIMRKSGLTPDEIMRRQLYSLLKPCPINPRSVNIIGNDFATDPDSELYRLIVDNGYCLKEIASMHSYAEYQTMAESFLNVSYNPNAKAGGETLKERLEQEHLYLPLSFDYREIDETLGRLALALGVDKPDYAGDIASCEEVLLKAKRIIGNTPIAIDYTESFRPLSLAKLLLSHGFNVTVVYLDSVTVDEKEDFFFLKEHYRDLLLCSTMNVKMRFVERSSQEKILAIGQKAAYFTGTNNFVNIVECGGLYGFSGIKKTVELMIDAYLEEKDARRLIQIKGMGCGCCL